MKNRSPSQTRFASPWPVASTVALLLVVGGAALLCAGGCSKPLLSPTEERTPFDRYDAVRGEFAQQYVEDKFGRRQPNLRARLAPKE